MLLAGPLESALEFKPQSIEADPEQIIAIDGGFSQLRKIGLTPTHAVGDWDSIQPDDWTLVQEVCTQNLDPKKDESDFFHALRVISTPAGSRIQGIGLIGGRLDHQLALLIDGLSWLERQSQKYSEFCLWSKKEQIYLLDGKSISKWAALLTPDHFISVLNIGMLPIELSFSGLVYGQKNTVLQPGGHGLSNRPNQIGRVEIELRQSGRVLLLVRHSLKI